MRQALNKTFLSILILLVLIAFGCNNAMAGEISGRLLNPRGFPISHIYDSCNIAGTNPSGTGTHTSATGTDGIFYHPNLPAGTYSHGFSEKDHYEALYFKGLNVPAIGNTWDIRQFKPATFCFGSEWFYSWHSWYAQSFRATGENVISVGLRTAGADGSDIAVAILDGDNPYAPQIGPTRTLGVSSTNGQCAYWSAGEVPTIPGRIYTVKLTVATGGSFSPWHQTVREQMRVENPDGRCWADGTEIDEPLELCVNQDDKGYVNTMCCARSNAGIGVPAGSYVGQTFTAKGSSVLMVTWLCGSNALWAVSVHDGVDAYGNPGAQIGPTKYVFGVAWDGRAIVTFSPGEVPTVPGRTYFVKLRLNAGASFVIYNAKHGDEYSGGRAYVGTTPQNFDFSLGIYEEKYTGSLDKPVIDIYGPRAESITATSAVLRWDTYKLADSTVEYSESTPYTNSQYDSTLTYVHSVPISGLTPNTMYHARVSSRASGMKEGVSKDFVFVTAPASRNLLADPDFESGAFGAWTKFGSGDIRITTSWLGGSGPRTGSYGLAGASNGGTVKGGAYQRVPAKPGEVYRLSAWLWTHMEGGDFNSKAYQTIARIGIDPTGGTNPDSPTVKWSPYTYSQDTWMQAAISAVASSTYVTVFLYGGNDTGLQWSIFSYDDIVLTTDAVPVETTITNALTQYPDGAYVSIPNVICTASKASAGDYYVESTDRTNGLRVSTSDTMAVGDKVTVVGNILTRNSGERYLANAAVLSRSASVPIKPLGARAVALGGSGLGPYCASVPGTIGPYNVGLLMRICGTVNSSGSGYIYINDGSLPGDGVKVNTTSLTSPPTVGQRAAVTGVVQLQLTGGVATVTLRPRNDLDVSVFP